MSRKTGEPEKGREGAKYLRFGTDGILQRRLGGGDERLAALRQVWEEVRIDEKRPRWGHFVPFGSFLGAGLALKKRFGAAWNEDRQALSGRIDEDVKAFQRRALHKELRRRFAILYQKDVERPFEGPIIGRCAEDAIKFIRSVYGSAPCTRPRKD